MANKGERRIDWTKEFAALCRLTLVSFRQGKEPDWNTYYLQQRQYWGADVPDGSRFTSYFGKHNTEQTFLAEMRKKYNSYVEHTKKWYGLCGVGESVFLEVLSDGAALISKERRGGRVKDHCDLVLELWEKRTLFGRRLYLNCRVFSRGTLTVEKNSYEHIAMGEPVGSEEVWHKKGFGIKTDVTNIRMVGAELQIDDAVFQVTE